MHSPIAKWLKARAGWFEKWHRKIHGPRFAPGDVVQFMASDGEPVAYTLKKQVSENAWVVVTPGPFEQVCRDPIRVVQHSMRDGSNVFEGEK